ncbi:SIMPL domain-containing protein [Actinoplanes sp. NPDC051633]|uniref:SIMPL domain-containing protein n=1 Tax=Actinoplanes sp. NPDC051633 TaxID=3155670 RepID=UPI003421C2EA
MDHERDLPTVVVRGEALREVPPELAVFSVTVSSRDKDRETTLTRLTERAAELRSHLDDFDDFDDAIERRETGSVQIYPEMRGRPKSGSAERVIAYHGSITTTVTVTDFAVLGELLLRLGNQEQTQVSGPWWQLRKGSRAGADVRKEAIADAVQRAREYAEAVGSRVQRLIEIADEGTGGAQPVMYRGFAAGKAEMAAADAMDLELDLDPPLQTVQAAVVVRVAISAPPKDFGR